MTVEQLDAHDKCNVSKDCGTLLCGFVTSRGTVRFGIGTTSVKGPCAPHRIYHNPALEDVMAIPTSQQRFDHHNLS